MTHHMSPSTLCSLLCGLAPFSGATISRLEVYAVPPMSRATPESRYGRPLSPIISSALGIGGVSQSVSVATKPSREHAFFLIQSIENVLCNCKAERDRETGVLMPHCLYFMPDKKYWFSMSHWSNGRRSLLVSFCL